MSRPLGHILALNYMGSRISKTNENDCINEINNINENNSDRSNIDILQMKAIKQLTKEL